MRWQPIETAPRDGTNVLGWDDAAITVVYYDDLQGGWRYPYKGGRTRWNPTFWMPLPDDPTDQDAMRDE